MNPMVRVRVGPAVRWALSESPRQVLARWWGVSRSRASHKLLDGNNELTRVAAYLRSPDIDDSAASAALAVLMEAYEGRAIDEARDDPKKLDARLAYLMSQEHSLEAAQNRALQSGAGVNAALRAHIAGLVEMVNIRSVRGLESE